MKILFISGIEFSSLNERNIYTDVLRELIKNGHFVYAVSPRVSRNELEVLESNQYMIIRPLIMKMQKVGVLKKGCSLLTLKSRYISAIKEHLSNREIDLILYATPPVNIVGVVEYCKKKYNAKTYLMLKDIWPDGIVDLGVIKRTSLIYQYFRTLEKRMYKISDRIGCMSKANVNYLLKHNNEVNPEKVEICPNCIEIRDLSIAQDERISMRKKYGIPVDKVVFVYGGNLGKPQGIPFIVECLETQKENRDIFFLIVGSGTEYKEINNYIKKAHPINVKLMRYMKKEDYDRMLGSCDVGLIFLDYRFTIPNFPSRLLSYMEAKLPILAVTDQNTDVGKVIEKGEFGWWCESNDVIVFQKVISRICISDLKKKGNQSYTFLKDNYSAKRITGLISELMREKG